VGVAVSSIWITLGLGQDVADHEEFALLDHPASLWVVDHRIGWLTAVLQVLTWFGSNAVLGPVLIIGCILLVRRRRSWLPAADIAVTYLGVMILYAVIKDGIERPRPPGVDRLTSAAGWLADKPDWAFPSGHAAQATVAWVLLCVLAWNGRSAKIKTRLAIATAALVLLVSFSRWYLGVAWLTDVLAGMTLGLAVLSVWGITRITIAVTDPEVSTDQPQHQ
jgi:undecaprenyl-diphosphatase